MHVVLLVFLLLFASTEVFAEEPVSVQLLWKHQFQFAGYYMAIEKGYYAEEGLEVTLKEYIDGVDLVDEVIKGRSQFAVGRTSLLIEKNAGADIVALFAAYQQSPLMLLTRQDSKILLSSDLKDKNIMITDDAKKVGELIAMMLQAGITLSDINQQQHSYNVQDLIDGKTDAMASYLSNEPFEMQHQGVPYNVIHPRDYGFDMYSDILFSSRAYIEQNAEITEKFYRASIKGWLYAFDNIRETATVIFNNYNTQNKSPEALEFEGRQLKKLAFDAEGNFGTLSVNKFNEMAQVYLVTGSIFRGYDFSDFIYQPPNNIYRFSAPERQFIREQKPLKVCINPHWYPYEAYGEGEHTGMISDYLKLILSKVGMEFEIVPAESWKSTLQSAKNGYCDLIAGAMQTVQRSRYLDFSAPYLTIPAVLAIRQDEAVSSLANKRIGVVTRSAFHDVLENRYKNASLFSFDNTLEGLRLLKAGKIDVMVGADANFASLMQKHHISGVAINNSLHDNWDISVAVVKTTPHLLSIVNKSIAAITPEQHEQINNRWMVVEYKHTLDYRVLWWLLGAVTVISMIAAYRFIRIKTYNRVLKELADKDALTGILSRRRLREELESLIELADRHYWPLSLIFFDIDDFKQINDELGHTAGDTVLIELTALVSDSTRKTDRFGRWGGEEFLFVMIETERSAAAAFAEKLRARIAERGFLGDRRVTCSFGVAEYQSGEQLESLVSRADEALYASKKSGKNCVTSA